MEASEKNPPLDGSTVFGRGTFTPSDANQAAFEGDLQKNQQYAHPPRTPYEKEHGENDNRYEHHERDEPGNSASWPHNGRRGSFQLAFGITRTARRA